MDIEISFTLHLDDNQMKDWALEYGLNLSEVASDATNHLGALVLENIKTMMHVEQFTTVKNYHVK